MLDTADAIIPEITISRTDDEALTVFSSQDSAVLILATLLHDIGMHVTEDGFFKLVRDERRGVISELDHLRWPELWQEFCRGSRRWDARTLNRLFGSSDPIQQIPTKADQIDFRSRLLIGEFLRRNHARIAHEAAVFGFPGSAGPIELLINFLTPEFSDITGLVARSHGLALRSATLYLKQKYHSREFQGIHKEYLMALIRIADYLQVHPSRAQRPRLEVMSLRSPLSAGEWKAHDCVRSISYHEDDPEAIHIHAAPPDVRTFLRMKNLLLGLQTELDMAWAVIGEKYGRDSKLNRLQLRLRRVYSNLDDNDEFASQVKYVPRRVVLQSAPADLLNLLVTPLYGDDLNIAVRELVQNSVDACRELDDALSNVPALRRPESDQTADVLVSLNRSADGWTFTISDRGIGMTADTIENYFLKAGASFRNSELWQKQHTSDGQQSRVMRSGRFGVGALAAFLLGPSIEVTTRHLLAPQDAGISFTVRLNDDLVELFREPRPVGTTIKIRMQESIGRRLFELMTRPKTEFGHLPDQVYLFSKPRPAIYVNGRRIKLGIRWPSQKEKGRYPTWHTISVEGYDRIDWNYSGRAGRVACNGIAVLAHYGWEGSYDLVVPNVSVIDPNAQLPLTLTRTKLIGDRLPFEAVLRSAVLRDLASWLLIEDTAPVSNGDWAALPVDRVRHPAAPSFYSFYDYVFTTGGTTLCCEHCLRANRIRTLVQYFGDNRRLVSWPIGSEQGVIYTRTGARRLRKCKREFTPLMQTASPDSIYRTLRGFHTEFFNAGLRIIVPAHSEIVWDGPQLSEDLIEKKTGAWICFWKGPARKMCLSFEHIDRLFQDLLFAGIVEYHLTPHEKDGVPEAMQTDSASDSPERLFDRNEVLASLRSYLGHNIAIPYAIEERRQKFAGTFSLLAQEIEQSEAIKKWRTIRQGNRRRR